MSKPTTYMVVEGPADKDGRVPFSLFWIGLRGRRAQCFRAVPDGYLAEGVILVSSEDEAKTRTWGSADPAERMLPSSSVKR